MQDYPSLDLKATANFGFENNPSCAIRQGDIHTHLGVHKPTKNSSFYDQVLRGRQQNGHIDTFQTQQSQLQPQRTLKKINGFQETNLNRQKANNFLSDPTKVAPCSSKDQSNNIFPGTLTESLQINSKFDFKENHLLDSFRDMHFKQAEKLSRQSSNIDIDMNLVDPLESLEIFPKKQRSLNKKHFITKQVAITYVPLRYASPQIKKAYMFTKFNPNSKEIDDFSSSRSISSNLAFGQNFELKDCMVNSTANFVKLHEVDLFMKRKEIRIERSDQLLVANEKLLTNHLVLKQELQKVRKAMENLQTQHKNKIEFIQHELNDEKEKKKQILAEKEAKQQALKSTKVLNEKYLRQKNKFQEIVKIYAQNIHQLKYELSRNRRMETNQGKNPQNHARQANSNNRIICAPLPTIDSLSSHYQVTDRTQVHIPTKKMVTLPAYQLMSMGNFQGRHAMMNANNIPQFPISPINNRKIKQRKLSTNEMMINKFLANIDSNNKSQKSIGVNKINTTHQNICSNKDQVKIDKNAPIQNSICYKIGEIQHDKSVSNISQKSGVSITRKFGYVPRPAHDSKKGVILDYLAQNEVKESTQDKEKHERFQYKKENS